MVILAGAAAGPGSAQAGSFSFDIFLGAPVNFDSQLKITQAGHEDLEIDAQWSSEPFKVPTYWDLRAIYWTSPTRGWAVDLCHNKLFLDDPPPEVQYFSVSHGLNLLTCQRLWVVAGNLVLVAAGVVVSHPENSVRNRQLVETGGQYGGGYYLAGPVLGAGVGRRFMLWRGLYGALEGRFTWCHATVPVADGEASFASATLHLMFGLGWAF